MKIDRLVRSKRRTIAIIIEADGSLLVRAPQRASRAAIQQFVEEKADWIEAKQGLVRSRLVPQALPHERFLPGRTIFYLGRAVPLAIVGRGPSLELAGGQFRLAQAALPRAGKAFEGWFRRQARAYLEDRAAALAWRWGFHYGRIRIGSAVTRWGSCSTSGTLSFPWRLVMAPPEVIDYVILHELVHTQVPNHSKAFWERLGAIAPDHAKMRKWLKEHAGELVV